MVWRNILVERDDGIGRITLNRPSARNPPDCETPEEILAALDAHFAEVQVRCIVIKGAGDSFCAGGDLKQMRQLSAMPAQEAYAWGDAIVAAHKRMLTADKPVIAAVHGPAFAGRMGLAAMCDIVIATRSASFAMPEVKIGLFPMIIVAHLARSLPRKVPHEMMLTGEAISATEGHRLGFVNRLAETREELETIVTEYGRRFQLTKPNTVLI
jgi:methylglutaconyl-CoA hydratase